MGQADALVIDNHLVLATIRWTHAILIFGVQMFNATLVLKSSLQIVANNENAVKHVSGILD